MNNNLSWVIRAHKENNHVGRTLFYIKQREEDERLFNEMKNTDLQGQAE